MHRLQKVYFRKAMQRKFITNIFLLLFLNLLVKPFWIFGIDRTVQNTVGAEDYGLYFSLFSLSFLFNMLLDIGITNFNSRNIAQHPQLVSKHFSNIFLIRLLLGISYITITFFTAWLLDYNQRQFHLLLFLGLNQFLLSFILYLRSNITGLQYFKLDSFFSVLDRLIVIGICSWLLWWQNSEIPFQIEWFAYAQTGAYFASCLFIFLVSLKIVKNFKINFDFSFFRIIIKKGIPFALLTLLMTFYYRVDAVMIEQLLPDGKFQAGIYAQAFRILDALSIVGYLFAGLLLPMFAKLIKEKKSVEGLVNISSRILLYFAITMAIILSINSKSIMELLYNITDASSSTILIYLMGSFIAVAVSYIFGTLLTANGNLKQLNLLALGGVTLNITLNYFLIQHYNAIGAAIASCITLIVIAILQIMIVQSKFQFDLNIRLISLFVLFSGILVIVSFFIYQQYFNPAITIMLSLIISIAIALLIKCINIKQIITIYKQAS